MKRLSVILGLLVIIAGAQATVRLEDQSNLIPNPGINAAAVAWGDVNNDGRPDLLAGDGGEDGSVLYLNLIHGFVPATAEYAIPQMTNVHSVEFVDYDGDGRLDIFCLSNDLRGAHLYHQNSLHRYQEVILLPIVQSTQAIRSAAWTDVDQDGDLDLLLSNLPNDPQITWLQQEGNDFIQMRGGNFPEREPGASAVCFADYDRDNDVDIFLGYSDDNREAKLYRNDAGRYIACQNRNALPNRCGMDGAVWCDINNDQFLDLILPGDDQSTYLLKSIPKENSRGFADITATQGFLSGVQNSRYVHCADLDMDGFQDLVVVATGNQPPRVVTNGNGEFWNTQLITWNSGHHRPTTESCALADYDLDGDVDILFAQGSDGLRLMRNETKSDHEWVSLLLETAAGSPLPDCQVTMEFELSKQFGTTSSITSSNGQNSPILYLVNPGPDKSATGQLTICWPNGANRTYPFSSLRMNQLNRIVEPAHQIAVEGQRNSAPVVISNSPNPFNPTTTVNFTLSQNEHVQLAVYDLLGREVAVLANGPYQAGSYALTFNASELPSGMYFARLATATATKLHRMMLIK